MVDNWAVSMPVEMPLVQTLSLRAAGHGESTSHGFLTCIKAPRLEVLMLADFTPDEISGFRCPHQFPSLQTLNLLDIMVGSEGLNDVLAALPDIRHLVFTFYDYWDFLSLLTPREDPYARPLPHLWTIALPMVVYPIPWADVRNLLVKRMSVDQRVQKLCVSAECLDEVAAIFPSAEGIVQVEEWQREMYNMQGWLAWSRSNQRS